MTEPVVVSGNDVGFQIEWMNGRTPNQNRILSGQVCVVGDRPRALLSFGTETVNGALVRHFVA
jgi:hypothetical protein